MFRTYLFFTAFVFSLVVTGLLLPVWYILGWFGLKNAQRVYGFHVSSNWARFLLGAAGVRVKVSGIENIPPDTTVLFVSNHQGNFDIPVLFSVLNKPIGFLAKIELTKIPVIRNWMPKLGCVFINRADLRQSIKAIQKCGDVLKNGQSMVIFPEGTRSKGGSLGEFKKGSLRLVEKSGVPVVPVVVNGTFNAMESRTKGIGPADVTVQIMPPVYYERMSREEKDDIAGKIKRIIAENLPK